jgi:hypothetical protein
VSGVSLPLQKNTEGKRREWGRMAVISKRRVTEHLPNKTKQKKTKDI